MQPINGLSRRSFVKLSSLFVGGLPLAGCCDYAPSIGSPVLWGYNDFTMASGLPVRVFYPSVDQGAVATTNARKSAALYTGCGKYPVIVFVHGMGTDYRSWGMVGSQLARCGFIVLMAETLSHGTLAGSSTAPTDFSLALYWLRSPQSPFYSSCDALTGFCGHSYGATTAGLLANELSANAVASIAGAWDEVDDLQIPQGIRCPALFAASDPATDPVGVGFDLTDSHTIWDQVARPKHNIRFSLTHHFDYVPLGAPGLLSSNVSDRGPCLLTPALIADFLCAFFSRYMGPRLQLGENISNSLIARLPSAISVKSFRSNFLVGFSQVNGSVNCQVVSTWASDQSAALTGVPQDGAVTLGKIGSFP